MSDADVERLPTWLRRAWGAPPPVGRRGRKASLTVDGIVDTAVALCDEEGIAGLSLVRVAERMGVTPNALYRYLDSREELEILLRERVLQSPPEVRDAEDWQDAVRRWAYAALERYERHPWFADLRSTVPITPHALTWLETLLAAFERSGLDEGQVLRAASLVDGFVRSQFVAGRDLQRWGSDDQSLPDAVAPLLAPRGLGRVSALFIRGEYVEPGAVVLRQEFAFGLDVLLDGLASRAGGAAT